jgi:hypothetical protein
LKLQRRLDRFAAQKAMLAAMTSKGEVAGQHLALRQFVRVQARAARLRGELQEDSLLFSTWAYVLVFAGSNCKPVSLVVAACARLRFPPGTTPMRNID